MSKHNSFLDFKVLDEFKSPAIRIPLPTEDRKSADRGKSVDIEPPKDSKEAIFEVSDYVEGAGVSTEKYLKNSSLQELAELSKEERIEIQEIYNQREEEIKALEAEVSTDEEKLKAEQKKLGLPVGIKVQGYVSEQEENKTIRKYFCCPITKKPFVKAVIASDGYSYESAASVMTDYLVNRSKDSLRVPETKLVPFYDNEYEIPNIHFQESIKPFVIQYKKLQHLKNRARYIEKSRAQLEYAKEANLSESFNRVLSGTSSQDIADRINQESVRLFLETDDFTIEKDEKSKQYTARSDKFKKCIRFGDYLTDIVQEDCLGPLKNQIYPSIEEQMDVLYEIRKGNLLEGIGGDALTKLEQAVIPKKIEENKHIDLEEALNRMEKWILIAEHLLNLKIPNAFAATRILSNLPREVIFKKLTQARVKRVYKKSGDLVKRAKELHELSNAAIPVYLKTIESAFGQKWERLQVDAKIRTNLQGIKEERAKLVKQHFQGLNNGQLKFTERLRKANSPSELLTAFKESILLVQHSEQLINKFTGIAKDRIHRLWLVGSLNGIPKEVCEKVVDLIMSNPHKSFNELFSEAYTKFGVEEQKLTNLGFGLDNLRSESAEEITRKLYRQSKGLFLAIRDFSVQENKDGQLKVKDPNAQTCIRFSEAVSNTVRNDCERAISFGSIVKSLTVASKWLKVANMLLSKPLRDVQSASSILRYLGSEEFYTLLDQSVIKNSPAALKFKKSLHKAFEKRAKLKEAFEIDSSNNSKNDSEKTRTFYIPDVASLEAQVSEQSAAGDESKKALAPYVKLFAEQKTIPEVLNAFRSAIEGASSNAKVEALFDIARDNIMELHEAQSEPDDSQNQDELRSHIYRLSDIQDAWRDIRKAELPTTLHSEKFQDLQYRAILDQLDYVQDPAEMVSMFKTLISNQNDSSKVQELAKLFKMSITNLIIKQANEQCQQGTLLTVRNTEFTKSIESLVLEKEVEAVSLDDLAKLDDRNPRKAQYFLSKMMSLARPVLDDSVGYNMGFLDLGDQNPEEEKILSAAKKAQDNCDKPHLPFLVSTGTNLYVYGYSADQGWGLKKLSSNLLPAVKRLITDFSSSRLDSFSSILNIVTSREIDPAIYVEIRSKKAHMPIGSSDLLRPTICDILAVNISSPDAISKELIKNIDEQPELRDLGIDGFKKNTCLTALEDLVKQEVAEEQSSSVSKPKSVVLGFRLNMENAWSAQSSFKTFVKQFVSQYKDNTLEKTPGQIAAIKELEKEFSLGPVRLTQERFLVLAQEFKKLLPAQISSEFESQFLKAMQEELNVNTFTDLLSELDTWVSFCSKSASEDPLPNGKFSLEVLDAKDLVTETYDSLFNLTRDYLKVEIEQLKARTDKKPFFESETQRDLRIQDQRRLNKLVRIESKIEKMHQNPVIFMEQLIELMKFSPELIRVLAKGTKIDLEDFTAPKLSKLAELMNNKLLVAVKNDLLGSTLNNYLPRLESADQQEFIVLKQALYLEVDQILSSQKDLSDANFQKLFNLVREKVNSLSHKKFEFELKETDYLSAVADRDQLFSVFDKLLSEIHIHNSTSSDAKDEKEGKSFDKSSESSRWGSFSTPFTAMRSALPSFPSFRSVGKKELKDDFSDLSSFEKEIKNIHKLSSLVKAKAEELTYKDIEADNRSKKRESKEELKQSSSDSVEVKFIRLQDSKKRIDEITNAKIFKIAQEKVQGYQFHELINSFCAKDSKSLTENQMIYLISNLYVMGKNFLKTKSGNLADLGSLLTPDFRDYINKFSERDLVIFQECINKLIIFFVSFSPQDSLGIGEFIDVMKTVVNAKIKELNDESSELKVAIDQNEKGDVHSEMKEEQSNKEIYERICDLVMLTLEGLVEEYKGVKTKDGEKISRELSELTLKFNSVYDHPLKFKKQLLEVLDSSSEPKTCVSIFKERFLLNCRNNANGVKTIIGVETTMSRANVVPNVENFSPWMVTVVETRNSFVKAIARSSNEYAEANALDPSGKYDVVCDIVSKTLEVLISELTTQLKVSANSFIASRDLNFIRTQLQNLIELNKEFETLQYSNPIRFVAKLLEVQYLNNKPGFKTFSQNFLAECKENANGKSTYTIKGVIPMVDSGVNLVDWLEDLAAKKAQTMPPTQRLDLIIDDFKTKYEQSVAIDASVRGPTYQTEAANLKNDILASFQAKLSYEVSLTPADRTVKKESLSKVLDDILGKHNSLGLAMVN